MTMSDKTRGFEVVTDSFRKTEDTVRLPLRGTKTSAGSTEVQWKPVKDYEDFYEVSTLGEVRSYGRVVVDSSGRTRNIKGKTMTPTLSKAKNRDTGYLTVRLTDDNRGKTCTVHRIVAKTFLENPDNLPTVNHKDGDKHNNSVANLEWCSYSDNNQHAHDTGLTSSRVSVAMLDKDTRAILQVFPSVSEASRFIKGTSDATGCIVIACKNLDKIAYGYKWRYYHEDIELPERVFSPVSYKNRKNKGKVMLPLRATQTSAGVDFYTPIDLEIKPGEKVFFSTDVKAYMQPNEFLLLTVRSSSGIKKDLMLSNTIGVIDSDYYSNPDNDGNIGISIRNLAPKIDIDGTVTIGGIELPKVVDLTTENTVRFKKGERIAQGIFLEAKESDNCNSENERSSGIGSTDK